MNLGFYNLYPKCNQNRMFRAAADIGDDILYSSWHLADTMKRLGHGIATIDTAPLDTFDAVVFVDYPTKLNPWLRRLIKRGDKPLYLIIVESQAVWPFNWNRANHAPFKKVFLWHPGWVDQKKYFLMRIAQKLPGPTPYVPGTATKFCCLISSQKYSWAKEELYSERVRAIRWFEKNHPDEFDLYGQRWDRFYFEGRLSMANPFLERAYSKCPWLPRRQGFPSWRGAVKSKRDTMCQYKFCICYENAGYPGWLTEKMLDAMFAGSVPIYQGDPEVLKIVPAGAFIDKRNFKTYDELYRYLQGMSETEYEGYRIAINDYINGDLIKAFGAEESTNIVLREIVNAHEKK